MSDRPCTCHPDDNPPVPCAKRYALTECKAAAYEALRSRLAEAEAALLRLADAASAIDVDRATKEWNVEEFDFAILQAREALRVTDSATPAD